MLQQTRRHELVRDRPQRLVVGLLLVNGAQLVQQRLETRQQVADTDGLARPPDQRLLEPQRAQPVVLLLLLLLLLVLFFSFLLLRNGALLLFGGGRGGRCSAAPAAWGHVACLRVVWGCIAMPGRWYGVQFAACAERRLVCARREQIGARRGCDDVFLDLVTAQARARPPRGELWSWSLFPKRDALDRAYLQLQAGRAHHPVTSRPSTST